MALTTYDQFIDRIFDGFSSYEPFWGIAGGTNNHFNSTSTGTLALIGRSRTLPSLPSGVTSFIPTRVFGGYAIGAVGCILVAKIVNMGNIDIGTNVFTDGAAMPTITALGASYPMCSPLVGVVTTALNATPGSLTVTYVDQDGNTAETTASHTLIASSIVGNGGAMTLNGDDWGIRDITNAVQSGGAAPTGVITFYGVIPIAVLSGNINSSSNSNTAVEDLLVTTPHILRLGANDEIGVFSMQGSTQNATFGGITYVGDN